MNKRIAMLAGGVVFAITPVLGLATRAGATEVAPPPPPQISAIAPPDLLSLTQDLQELQMSFNLQYLQLQDQLQQENSQFTLISDLLKELEQNVSNTINNVR